MITGGRGVGRRAAGITATQDAVTVVGFHASHEQIHPAQLLRDVQHAEQAGFDAAMCSDHLEPWSARQGHSGFAWSWLGAAMATTRLPFGVVNAPGQRYHPVIVAQAAATLAAMFPGRFWVALGSGENMNEHVTGDKWPRKDLRQQRLRECVDVIRGLLDGEEVTHEGLVTVDRARLWTRPETPPPLVCPAVSVRTAGECAAWADALATINQPAQHLRRMLDAYRGDGGGKAVLQSRPKLGSDVQWANFVRNHDELTLDKLSDDERQEVFAAFGPEERMQVYGRGLKRRLPPSIPASATMTISARSWRAWNAWPNSPTPPTGTYAPPAAPTSKPSTT